MKTVIWILAAVFAAVTGLPFETVLVDVFGEDGR